MGVRYNRGNTNMGASASSASSFRDGQIVGARYRIVRFVGRGGMGEVYQAEDLELGLNEPVAIKTLLPDIAGDDTMIARFKKEIALSRRIAHPNVCRVFDLARHENADGRPIHFLTMEFLDGETLQEKLRREGPLTASAALPLLEQMAGALDASHAAGVIHRDFKPSNVMLVPNGEGTRAVVTDFGLARRCAASGATTATMSDAVVGTLDYMPPEVLAGAPATFAADIYTLGMTAYRMVTGSLPFKADTPLAAAMMRMRQPPPSPRRMAPGLDAIWERALLRALNPKPAERFSSAGQFTRALRGEPVPSAVIAPLLTRRRAAIATAVVVLAAGAVAVWRLWGPHGQSMPLEAQALYQKGAADISAGAYFAATQALGDAARLAPHSAQVHARLAEAWLELDLPEKAGEEMLLVRRQYESALPRLDRLRIEAIDLAITREYPAATAKYEEMERAGGATPGLDVDLGRAYEKASQPEKAIASYRRATASADPSAAAWLRLGVLYARQSNRTKSDDAFAQAGRLYQLTSNLEGLTELALQEGQAATTRGELDAAAIYFHKALDTSKVANNQQEEINATLRLSTNAMLTGDAPAAEKYASEALETARANHLDALAISGLVKLGTAYFRKQDYAASEKYFRDALTLAQETHSAWLSAMSSLALAGLHDQMSEGKQAVAEARDALSFYEPNHYAKETLQALTVIVRAQRASGDYEGALASARSQLQTAGKTQDRYQMALAHESIGAIFLQATRYPAALDAYRNSLNLAADSEQIGWASLGCGDSLWRLGRFGEAAGMFAKAAEAGARFNRLKLYVISHRAGMANSQLHFREAADLARSAAAEDQGRDRDLQVDLDRTLGLALMGLGNKHEGLDKCKAAWAEATNPEPSDRMRNALALLQALLENGQKAAALELFHSVESGLPAFPDLNWRALALLSGAEPSYAARARDILAGMSPQWGESVYNVYLTQPDVQKLSRPLFR